MFLLISLIIAFAGFVFVSLVYAESQHKINTALEKAKGDTDLPTGNQHSHCLVEQANRLIVGNMVSIDGELTPYQLMRVYVGKDGYQWASVLDMNNLDCPSALTEVRTNLLSLEPQLNNWNEQNIRKTKQINA